MAMNKKSPAKAKKKASKKTGATPAARPAGRSAAKKAPTPAAKRSSKKAAKPAAARAKRGSESAAPAGKTSAKAATPAAKRASKKAAKRSGKAAGDTAASGAAPRAAKKAGNRAGKAAGGTAKPVGKRPGKKATRRGAASEGESTPPASSDEPPSGRLSVGDIAPAFRLESDVGGPIDSNSLRGQRFVLYFYPKDDTPGCTKQACDFRDLHPTFEEMGVRVLGISGDNLQSHGRFRKKYELPFPLLSDPGNLVAKAYGAVGERSMYGRKFIGVIRSTFVIGPDGRIETMYSPVRVPGHAEQVLEALHDTVEGAA